MRLNFWPYTNWKSTIKYSRWILDSGQTIIFPACISIVVVKYMIISCLLFQRTAFARCRIEKAFYNAAHSSSLHPKGKTLKTSLRGKCVPVILILDPGLRSIDL